MTDSREVEGGIRRRRECLGCGLRFTTYERVQNTVLVVAKRDGRREEFRRDKLLAGITKACAKRPIPLKEIEHLVDEIEAELQRLGHAEIPSALLGEMVMERLKRLDWVAYIRFASVYKDFKDVESFEQEVKELKAMGVSPQGEVEQLSLLPPPAPDATKATKGRGRKRTAAQGKAPSSPPTEVGGILSSQGASSPVRGEGPGRQT